MSDTPEYDVQVKVRTQYIARQSDPAKDHYVFAYHVTIENHGLKAARLMSRRWLIVDSDFRTQEVTGDGVIGKQPTIAPGKSFEYSSGCVLETEVGTMEGHYDMVAEDGHTFTARIAKFVLSAPRVVH
jgi:ApaG protein